MVFLLCLLIVFSLFVLLCFTKIVIQIDDLEITSLTIDKKHVNDKYKVSVKIFILGKIPIFKYIITKSKLNKFDIGKRIEKLDLTKFKFEKFEKDIIKIVKNIEFNITKINLNVEIGTENAFLTSMLIPFITTLFYNFLRNKIKKTKDQEILINPLFYNKNIINIRLSAILEINVMQIANTVYDLNKKENTKNKLENTNKNRYKYRNLEISKS